MWSRWSNFFTGRKLKEKKKDHHTSWNWVINIVSKTCCLRPTFCKMTGKTYDLPGRKQCTMMRGTLNGIVLMMKNSSRDVCKYLDVNLSNTQVDITYDECVCALVGQTSKIIKRHPTYKSLITCYAAFVHTAPVNGAQCWHILQENVRPCN